MRTESFRKKCERTFRDICRSNDLKVGTIRSGYDDWFLTISMRLQNTSKAFTETVFQEYLRKKTEELYELAGTEKDYMIDKCERILVQWEREVTGDTKAPIHHEVWARYENTEKMQQYFQRVFLKARGATIV